ncbi:hypothetical protein [Aquimarina algiphila]|uniref:hypothetical protein n=1 Tax=Aquimarina algiphila TaxID=2047982 RepID=UPI00232B0E76|nr:hypothetical protein [Aquimarina algiphila]
MELFTKNNIEITDRIRDGRTTFFEGANRQEAKEFAKQTGSYPYEVFKDKDKKRVFAGFAVPK